MWFMVYRKYGAYFEFREAFTIVRAKIALEFIRLTRVAVDMVLEILFDRERGRTSRQ